MVNKPGIHVIWCNLIGDILISMYWKISNKKLQQCCMYRWLLCESDNNGHSPNSVLNIMIITIMMREMVIKIRKWRISSIEQKDDVTKWCTCYSALWQDGRRKGWAAPVYCASSSRDASFMAMLPWEVRLTLNKDTDTEIILDLVNVIWLLNCLLHKFHLLEILRILQPHCEHSLLMWFSCYQET